MFEQKKLDYSTIVKKVGVCDQRLPAIHMSYDTVAQKHCMQLQ